MKHVTRSVALVVTALLTTSLASAQVEIRERTPVPPPHEPGGTHEARVELEFEPKFRGQVMHFDLMRGYIDVVERFARLARDPTSAGIAGVIAAGDLLKPRGTDAGIEFFTKALETAKNDAVRRAIRIQLVELYKQSGQHDKALEHLTDLINGAPAGAGGAEAQPPPPRPSGR